MNEHNVLAGRVRESLAELERVVDRALLLYDKALKTGDDGYWDGVALNLHGFYAGVERIFEDIARTVDSSVPDGSDWHRDLLLQMSAEVPTLRPPIITRNTRRCLEAYQGFRHVVRNVYAFNLRPVRLQELAAELTACFKAVSNDLGNFCIFLERLSRPDDV